MNIYCKLVASAQLQVVISNFGNWYSNFSGPIIIYYVLYNNFPCTHLVSIFVPQEDFYYAHDDTDALFLFILQ